jgi:signal peptidase I
MNSQARDEGRCRLAAEALRSAGKLKVRANGLSMLPTLWPGDVLTVQSIRPEQADPGEIVLYLRRGRFFIHRIVDKPLSGDGTHLITRGDCMAEDDPRVERSELLGKVIEVRRANSVFVPARRLSPFHRLVAWLFCHSSLFRQVGLRVGTYCRESDDQVEATFVSAA